VAILSPLSMPRSSFYLLARARGVAAHYEALRVYQDVLAACQTAIMLSQAEPRAVYRVTADGRRTVLLATAGRGHWLRLAL
jgi:hypothetical protein